MKTENRPLSDKDEQKYRELLAYFLAAEIDSMRPRSLEDLRDCIHKPEVCKGEACCIHNPSEHALNQAPLQLRGDRSPLMERVCPHGVGHPDPDSIAYIDRASKGRRSAYYESIHGCDGCCTASMHARITPNRWEQRGRVER